MSKKLTRIRRSKKTRAKIKELNMHRLSVHRTSRHIYAQLISPQGDTIIASASTLKGELPKDKYTGGIEAAAIVGKAIGEAAKSAGVTNVAFDRSGFKYHGRVKALAEAAREAGLKF